MLSITKHYAFWIGGCMRLLAIAAPVLFDINIFGFYGSLENSLEVFPYNLFNANKISYILTLALLELCILIFLFKIHKVSPDEILKKYWLSPISIFVLLVMPFWVFPEMVMAFCLLLIKYKRRFLSAILISAASVFVHPVFYLLVPFSASYFWVRGSYTSAALNLFLAAAALFFTGYYNLVQIHLNFFSYIYVFIFIYLFYKYTNHGKEKFSTLLVYLYAVFFGLFIFDLKNIACFILVPYIVLYFKNKNQNKNIYDEYIFLAILFSLISIDVLGLQSEIIELAKFSIFLFFYLRILFKLVFNNQYILISNKPLSVGIAGDSGAGKDTFSDALKLLFGVNSVVTLSGDDYHLWDRQKPIWQKVTHLNPFSNDLETFIKDFYKLLNRENITARHYDHCTGQLTRHRLIESKDIILVSGLHALYYPMLRRCYDLKIYLDMDEDLRRYFKIARDVSIRGYSQDKVLESFKQREGDSVKYIRPQERFADLVFKLLPVNYDDLNDLNKSKTLKFKLLVTTRYGLNELSFVRALIGICGLHVDTELNVDNAEYHFLIEGDCYSEDISMVAKIVCPRILDFIDHNSIWADGVLGIMQLVTLVHVEQCLDRRLLN